MPTWLEKAIEAAINDARERGGGGGGFEENANCDFVKKR